MRAQAWHHRVVSPEPSYPFTPKSNRYLRPGQFWAIPLSDGRFAAGRVMSVPAFGPKDRTGVVVGLADWVGDKPPTADDLAGKAVLVQAKSGYEAVTVTGGQVLGLRPLEHDGLVSMDPDDFSVGTTQNVWGGRTIAKYAEQAFGTRA
jgi:hypothetical protein